MAASYPGMNDVTAWGEKKLVGAYRPGTTMKIAGHTVKLGTVPDYLGGEKRPRAKPVAKR